MKKPLHPVSDHAVIRYMERVMGLDMDVIRVEIGQKVDLAMKCGASGAVVDGFSYKITNGVVTTVIHANRTDHHIGTYRRQKDLPDEIE